MYTLILALILAALSLIGIIVCSKKGLDCAKSFVALLFSISVGAALCFMIFITITNPLEIEVFERQKDHIVAISFDDLQNTGSIIPKIEQNKWLYEVQFKRERFGDWCGYPASVLDLEPIW